MTFRRDGPLTAFLRWSDRVEHRLKCAVWLLVVLLLLTQTALQFPAVRAWFISTEKWEGVPYTQQAP